MWPSVAPLRLTCPPAAPGVAVGVAVTKGGGVPVTNACAVSQATSEVAIAMFSAVGVLVTTRGVGVAVART